MFTGVAYRQPFLILKKYKNRASHSAVPSRLRCSEPRFRLRNLRSKSNRGVPDGLIASLSPPKPTLI